MVIHAFNVSQSDQINRNPVVLTKIYPTGQISIPCLVSEKRTYINRNGRTYGHTDRQWQINVTKKVRP